MATAELDARKQTILDALKAAVQRQASSGSKEMDLVAIAVAWTRGAVKTVPPQWLPGPRELRAWTLAAGTPEADRYLLGLHPSAPDTHPALASAMMRVGIAPTLIGTRGSRPALRISGRRRLSRLVENVGEPPDDIDALAQWPRIEPV